MFKALLLTFAGLMAIDGLTRWLEQNPDWRIATFIFITVAGIAAMIEHQNKKTRK